MPSVPINGIELFYDEQNPHERDETVVFLHGAAGNHVSWWQQVPVFREQYRCISIDHRGFGRSLDPQGEGTARFVDDLEALLDALSVERTALVAQSMGGRTALGFTVRHPERVTALVMADTWGFFDWPELQEEATRLRDAAGQGNDTPLTERALGAKFQRENPAGGFLYRQIAGLNPPRAQQSLVGGPTRDEVAALTVPTLFLVGSEDMLTPPPILKRVHEIVAGSRFVEVPERGHSVYFEDPAVFNETVGAFLAEHAAVAAD